MFVYGTFIYIYVKTFLRGTFKLLQRMILTSDANGSILGVDRFPHIVQAWSPQYDPTRPEEAGHGEQPEEESVQHHRYVFPVLHHLVVLVIVPDVLSNELDPLESHLDLRAEPV